MKTGLQEKPMHGTVLNGQEMDKRTGTYAENNKINRQIHCAGSLDSARIIAGISVINLPEKGGEYIEINLSGCI